MDLQDNILEIANIFRSKEFYIPVRMDQRGRVYCSPSYLNYQSNDLAKSLLLFSVPGIIKRGDTESVNFLKVFGSNCYGNGLSKLSFDKRVEWVDNNIENIINYENGILLNKSKGKELFLSFCIEFRRYYNFLNDENLKEFKTYLPIQLDATCNGFQHLALLSEEYTLYEKLNLTDKKNKRNDGPSDFYNYMLLRLDNKFRELLKANNLVEGLKESIIRLSNFVWNRDIIKKVVMTKPYNASRGTITKYLRDHLILVEKVEDKVEGKHISWYGLTHDSTNLINSKDLNILAGLIDDIIKVDFTKIYKLIQYLNNIASVCSSLNIPISWNLPRISC